jgi:hypothetical protein
MGDEPFRRKHGASGADQWKVAFAPLGTDSDAVVPLGTDSDAATADLHATVRWQGGISGDLVGH